MNTWWVTLRNSRATNEHPKAIFMGLITGLTQIMDQFDARPHWPTIQEQNGFVWK